MDKRFQKHIARLLIVFMITVMLPIRVFAEGKDSIVTTAQEISENINIESEELEAKIVGEVKEKREKNVKYFFKDNGTYEAAIYDTPVHYLENGVWKDIDNSLVDEKDEEGNDILGNKENDYKIKIAKNSNSKKLVKIQKDKYELSWNIENGNKSKSEVQALDEEKLNEDTAKEVEKDLENNKALKRKSQTEKEKIKKNAIENEKKKIVKNTSSSVKFSEILEGVDLSYDILGDNVKENIIINKPIENSTFKFNLYIKNLVPKLQKDKTIVFYDEKDTNKAVFMMNAPFMVDAKGEHSENIEITLEQSKKDYILTLTPDKEWINNLGRLFPIVIDPPVRTDLGVNSIQDSFVGSNVAGNNYSNAISLGVGNGSGSGITRSFLKFQLPQELNKPGSVVVNAKLNLALYKTNLESRQINVHKVLGDWQSSTITWNNKPDYYANVEDYENVKGELGTWFDWDITSIVREWLKSGKNYGVMLKYDNESTGYNEFFSSDYGDEIGRPQIIIQYVNNSGLESYWTYQSQSAGRAGTGYINSANGNLVFVHNDLSMSGNKMPVTINHVYNSNDRASSIGYGNGWRLNLNQRVTPKTFFNETWYEYIDEDGTLHYFSPSSESGVYRDESGIDLTLKKNADESFTIEDKENNKLIFNYGGYLIKIQDSNGNTQLLSYDGTKLKSVTEKGTTNEMDRTTEFISSTAGYLLKIIDPSKRETIFGYEGQNLTKIIYPDKNEITYNYYDNNNLKDAINIDKYKISYEYSPNSPYLVNKVQEFGTDNSSGSNLNLVYGNNSTIFTQIVNEDPGIRRNIYQFNDYGNTISIKDNEDATGVSYNFGRNLGTDKNKLTLESKLQKTIINYLKNHNVEITNNSWSAGNDSASVGSAAFTTEHKYIGNQALKITKTNNTGAHFYKQAVTLQKGKTYTFSGYIRAKDISSASKKGAVLYVESGGQIIAQSNFIRGDSDWQKVEATFAIRQDAATAAVEVKAGIIEGTGTAYFDCFQLEEGEISNRYNLVENSDFNLDNGAGTYWNKANGDANDKVVSTDNKLAFQIKGSAALKKSVNQTIKVSGKKGDTFVLSGWAIGKSVPVTEEGERLFALDIGIKKNSGGYQYKVVTFNPDSSEWQYAADAILAEDDYSEVNVYGLYYGNLNTASFDNIQLYREEFAQSYSYDDKGNLASTQNLAAQKSEFKYDGNNNLVNAIDPKGSNFKYTYDEKHNIKTAASGENVIYSFDYDSNGNPVKAKIGDDSLFINSESTYTPSGNYISKLTDASGNEVDYTYYDEVKGNLKTVTDGKRTDTTYTYYDSDKLESVFKQVDGQEVKNVYKYKDYNKDDKLETITHNGFNYKFEYDVFGNNNKVLVGEQNLITNTFDNLTGNLTNSTYGNGHMTSIIYDNLGRITGRKYNGVEKFKYSYDAFGNLGKHEDLENGISYRYFYDMANRLTKVEDSNKNSTEYSFDINSNLNSATEKINNVPYATKYQYDRDNKLKDIYYDRYKVDNSKVQSFSLNNNLMGDKGINPYDENAVFEKNDAYDTALAAYEGTTNLVKNNSSFENSTSSWVIGDMSSGTGKLRVVNDGFYGTKALELYDSDGLYDGSLTNTAAYQYVELPAALTAPKTYTLSTYAKRIGDVNPEIYVDYIDAGGKEQHSNQDSIVIPYGKWTRISKSLTAPAGTKKIRVVVRAQVKDEFVVRFDGVQLEEKNFTSAYTEGTLQPSKVLYDLGMNKASGTMSVWFNTSQNGTTRHIIGNQKDTAQLFNVYLDSSNRLNLSIIDNGVFRNVITLTDAVEKDKWNFVSVTWRMEGDTLKCKLYLNDKVIKEGTVVNPVDFTGAVTALGSSIKGTQQLNGRLQQFSFSKELLNDEEVTSLYNAGRLSSTTSVSINYDELGRLKYKLVNPEGTSFKTSYQYEIGEKSNSTTTKVSELDNNGQRIAYSYDDNGNIEVISYKKEALFEATNIYYTYNELNELIREDNEVLNKTIKYSYDVGGNLLKKEEFAYTREVPGTPTKTYEYKYEDTNWKDKLTSFNGKSITYDAIGNPLNDGIYTYTWEQGRQLKSMTKEGSSISFKYNDSGIRTEKTVDGVTTKYYLNGDQVAYEDNGTDKIYYTYDSDGSLVSMNLNGVEYYYIRNLQGDIIGLFDKNGTQVVSYTYDTWGKHDGKAELKDENGNVIQQGDIKGTLASTVGVKNPYRYRAYRFDTETGLYYLQSRYYNPEWSRFINADGIGGKVGDLLSHNVFIYCQNNPVMNSDTSGQWFETFLDVVSVVSSFVNLMRNPSWKAATVLAYDCAAAVAPVVPASGTLKAAAKAADALKISKKGSVAKSVASKGVAKSNTIKGGRFAAVDSIKGVDEVGHHMAQNAYNKTIGISRADGPALLMTKEDHSLTRTFAGRGRATMINDVGLTARQRLAKDIMDVRSQFGRKYNEGMIQMLDYAKTLPQYGK